MKKSGLTHITTGLIPFLLFIAFTSGEIKAQKAVLSLDTSSIRIGERVQLRMNATLPKSATIYWPSVADTITSVIEVASKSKVDTNATSRKEFVNYSQNIIITSFDSGFHYIPPFKVYFSYAGDTSRHELVSDGVYLKVRTVEVDTTQAIRDIRGPMQAPVTFEEIAPFLGGAAILGLIIGMIWYYFWRKKMNKPIFPALTKVQGPPWEIALNELLLLDQKKLWQNGKTKEYYTELTDILRHYLEKQHSIEAMEMITSEILTAYNKAGLPEEPRKILENLLMQADFAKFAKAVPGKYENENSMPGALKFIENTKPVTAVADEKVKNSTQTDAEPKEPNS